MKAKWKYSGWIPEPVLFLNPWENLFCKCSHCAVASCGRMQQLNETDQSCEDASRRRREWENALRSHFLQLLKLKWEAFTPPSFTCRFKLYNHPRSYCIKYTNKETSKFNSVPSILTIATYHHYHCHHHFELSSSSQASSAWAVSYTHLTLPTILLV